MGSHRKMLPGDIVTPEYIADILMKHLKGVLGLTYPEFLKGQFACGGIVNPKPLPVHPEREGVVGYIMGGRPIYDADWFDQKMHSGGNVVTVRIGKHAEKS